MAGEVMRVDLIETDAGPARLEELTRSLRRELLELPAVETVDRVSEGAAPEGAKAADVAALGALVVGAQPSLNLITQLVQVVRGWFNRGAGERALKVAVAGQTLELTRATAEQQDAAVRMFLDAVERANQAEGQRGPQAG
jgi:hypothetical protein